MPTARINHNTHLQDVHRTLAVHSANMSKEIGQLSSGLRVERASDDPASLALADGIRSEVRAITEGTRNIQQTFSLLQVADGSLSEIAAMVNRMRTLAMQAGSSIFNDVDRQNINSEFEQLREEIDRIAGSTTYNGRQLLTGGNNSLGPGSTAADLASTTGLSDIRIDEAIPGTYTFIDEPGDGLLTIGNGVQTQTVSIGEDLQPDGSVGDTEFFRVIFDRLGVRVSLTGADVAGAPGVYIDGALDGQQLVVEEESGLTFQMGPSETSNDVSRVDIMDMRASGPILNLTDISIVTINDAHNALERLGNAIQSITTERNLLGAFQNRLQLSVATSDAVVERMVNTESEIREVDVARSITNLSRSQVLSQVATQVAIEADTDIERILSLLS